METYFLENDITVLCVKAAKFPEGIGAAWNQLHLLAPKQASRKYYGISRPENGTIVYKAAATQVYENEAEQLGCETFIIEHGHYVAEMIKDWHKTPLLIGQTFQQLLSEPDLDPNGACIEMYENEKDVKCMVRLKDSK